MIGKRRAPATKRDADSMVWIENSDPDIAEGCQGQRSRIDGSKYTLYACNSYNISSCAVQYPKQESGVRS